MKSHMLLALLLVVSATGSLMSMVPGLKDCTQMKFFLDSKDYIKRYSVTPTYNWPFQNVVGKNFFSVLPFNDSGLAAFGKASTEAQGKMVTVRVLWILENEK